LVEIAKYILVQGIASVVHISPDTPDIIAWSFTLYGIYNASSAYHAQFIGSHPRFNASKIWNAHTEPKCKLFSWLALHGKLLTADMLADMLAVRGWPHDPTFPLCLGAPKWQDTSAKTTPIPRLSGTWSNLGTMDNLPPDTS
jgi:hypothetical protein